MRCVCFIYFKGQKSVIEDIHLSGQTGSLQKKQNKAPYIIREDIKSLKNVTGTNSGISVIICTYEMDIKTLSKKS